MSVRYHDVCAVDMVILACTAHSHWTQRFHQQMSRSGHKTVTFRAAYVEFACNSSSSILDLPCGHVDLYIISIWPFLYGSFDTATQTLKGN